MTQPDTYRIDDAEVNRTAESHRGSAVFAARQQTVAVGVQARSSERRDSGAPLTTSDHVPQANSGTMDDDALLAAKLESLAEFAAGAGHEINNPLAAISGRAQLLLKDETDPERRRHLLTIGAQALRIRDMIGDVMLFARPPEPQPRSINLREIMDDVLPRFADALTESKLSIEKKCPHDVVVWADETQLRIVLSELLRNAIEFSPTGTVIRMEAASRCEEFVTVTIHDAGPGLSATDREHLFDPFYSGRQAGRGLGFGLPKCWRIVTLHGGRIRPDEKDGFGIVIDWPTA